LARLSWPPAPASRAGRCAPSKRAADNGAQTRRLRVAIDGQKVQATFLQGATLPLNVTGLPGILIRFGTSKEGMPMNVQLVGSWLAESAILHVRHRRHRCLACDHSPPNNRRGQ
jgi:Asp-tRNA(Asn)/Glu-tRNA(Gln) amidotransferase A subunit family amidase